MTMYASLMTKERTKEDSVSTFSGEVPWLRKTDEFSCHPIEIVSILDDEFWDERMLNYYADPLLIKRIEHKPAIYSLVHQKLLEL